jgi:hypothetical protein
MEMKMELIKNRKYIISVNFNGKILTYNCIILEDDGTFFKFKDKFGDEYTYNKNIIVSVRESNGST